MGISALADGVETEDQAAALRKLGCQVGQGFYFSQPLRAEEFDELLRRHFARTAGPGGPGGPVLIDQVATGTGQAVLDPAR